MKHLLLLFFISLYYPLSAQNSSELISEATEFKSMKSYLAKITLKDWPYMIPFQQDKKWGYLDQRTMKITVPALANTLYLFKPEGYIGTFNDYKNDLFYTLTLDEEGKLRTHSEQVAELVMPPQQYGRSPNPNIKSISSENGYTGFEYKVVAGDIIEITAYSDLYTSHNVNEPKLTPIRIDGKVYAVAGKSTADPNVTHFGIIASDGKPLPGFNFEHQKVIPIGGVKDTTSNWFLVQPTGGRDVKYSYMNHKGEYKLKDSLSSRIYNWAYQSSQEHFPYYMPVKTTAGYFLTDQRIIDTYELKYINSIPQKFRLEYLDYMNTKAYNKESPDITRQTAKVFVVVSQEGKSYYMDLEGKIYEPQ